MGEITDRCLFRVGRGGNALVAGDRILRFEERLGWFSRERRLLKGVVRVKWPGIGAIRPARNVAVRPMLLEHLNVGLRPFWSGLTGIARLC